MVQQLAKRLFAIVGLLSLLWGCVQQPHSMTPPPSLSNPGAASPSTGVINLTPVQLPEGYAAVGAIGDTLVLRNRQNKDGVSLVLYKDGQIGDEIAKRPWNTVASFASDDRWFVWSETLDDMATLKTDRWTIWAWDSVTRTTRQIAQYNATAEELQLPIRDIVPRVRMSEGRVLWASFDMAPTPKLRLHLVDLEADSHEILVTTEPTPSLFAGYDIHGSCIAYRLGKQVVIISDAGTETIATDSDFGEVVVTADGVAWAGAQNMFWHDSRGTTTISYGVSNRWWYTATDHYITWLEAPGNQLKLLHTPSRSEHVVISSGVNNGGRLFGKYVAWTQQVPGQSSIGMVAKLP